MKEIRKENPLSNKKVAIVGGGPGGLTLARILQMNGADVKVYERDANRTARVYGATLNLNEESGLKALHEAGLMEPFRAVYRPGAGYMVLVDKVANVLLEIGDEKLDEERPEIDRAPLRELLLNSLHPNTVEWDHQFISLKPADHSITLEFKNGKSAVADLVVAADGANSKVRSYITQLKPLYSGVTIVEGTVYDSESKIPKIHKLLNGGKICVLGDEKTLFIGLKGDGSALFNIGLKTEEFWFRDGGINFSDQTQLTDWFKKEFTGWSELWLDLLKNATPPFIPRPQYCAPLDQTWEPLPNLTLLGDAAHVMPPYAGEGVNMAMLDALELAQCLRSEEFTDCRSAITTYEKKMRARSALSAKDTMEFTAAFHSAGAIPFFLDFFRRIGVK